jgi:hypothetical protein
MEVSGAEILTFCLLILGFSHGSRYGFVLMSSYQLICRSHCLMDHLKCNLLVYMEVRAFPMDKSKFCFSVELSFP